MHFMRLNRLDIFEELKKQAQYCTGQQQNQTKRIDSKYIYYSVLGTPLEVTWLKA